MNLKMQFNDPPGKIKNNMTTPHLKKSIGSSSSRLALLLIPLVLVCIGLLPNAQAVVPPPPGGYPNFTTATGDHALQALTTGVGNTAIGTFSLSSVSFGNFNTAVGAGSLDLNQNDSNTAIGAAALLFNTAGIQNTAVGAAALEFNDAGSDNTANGAFALSSNTTGNFNTAIGYEALFSNTTGINNTAVGDFALTNNTEGNGNTANGLGALESNTTGNYNTATGFNALASNITGQFNTAIGDGALINNTTGQFNTVIGDALINNTTGSQNTAIGWNAGSAVVTADSVIAIGIVGADVSNTTWINNVYGVTTQSGTAAPVIVSDTGQLGTVVSSERFKKDIAGMEKASETILSLRPVTFHYKTDITDTPQFGLIAEEVAKVNPALVLPDKEGKPYTVRYEAVNAMLLNEFLKAHSKMGEQEATIAELKAGMAALTATVKEQASQIQNVSAQLELNKPAPQTVLNNQ